MKRLGVFLLIVLAHLLAVSGCGTDTADENAVDEGSTEQGEDGPAAIVVDQMGREVVFTETAKRIVSISPASTEIVFALGLGENLIAVTDYCNYPEEALAKDKIGDYSNPNLEKIMAMEPDLVLADSWHKEVVLRLEDLEVSVLVLVPESIEEIYEALEMIAAAAGAVERCEELKAEMTERLSAIAEKLSSLDEEDKVRVYYEVYSDPLMSIGNQSLIHEIITLARGKNIFADIDDNYPVVSAEVVAEREPQIILYPAYHGSEEIVLGSLQERPGWGGLPAIKEGRIHGVDEDKFSRHGPRVVEAVEEAAQLFYPELF
ncbi:MAG: ABC transporter substrate-binding protein [Dethiobacteria bacterium]|jgi:iron complex transport system substrate-binding protein